MNGLCVVEHSICAAQLTCGCLQVAVREGEELTLTDNSNAETWRVRTLAFRDASVPSIVCLIPGPDAGAVNLANRYAWGIHLHWCVGGHVRTA